MNKVDQSLSCVWLFATPWTAAPQASLSITNSRSLLKLMSTESVMPSNHLILCRPLLLLPSILPSIRVFSNESFLRIKWPKCRLATTTKRIYFYIWKFTIAIFKGRHCLTWPFFLPSEILLAKGYTQNSSQRVFGWTLNTESEANTASASLPHLMSSLSDYRSSLPTWSHVQDTQ